MHKDIPRENVFGNSELCSSRQNYNRPNSLENCSFGRKNKTQSFQKLFLGGYLFVFVKYLCNRSLKIKTKNIKNSSSILTVVNHRNWLDDSPPLSEDQKKKKKKDLRPKTFMKSRVSPQKLQENSRYTPIWEP